MKEKLNLLEDIPEEVTENLPALQTETIKEGQKYSVRAREYALAIKDDRSYKEAAEFYLVIKGFRKQVEEAFGGIVTKAHAAWKAATALRSRADDPLDEAEKIIKSSMGVWDAEQKRKRRLEEDRIRMEQTAKAEEERKKQAVFAAKQGDIEKSQAIMEAPPAPVAPVVLPTPEKIKGVQFRENWKFRIVNAKLIPQDYQIPDEVKIGKLVRALKNETNIPGIEVYCERV